MMRSHIKAVLLLSAVFLAGCGGQQARELSETWKRAGDASVTYAQSLKAADLAQQKALVTALSQQKRGPEIINAYREQVTTRGELMQSAVDADYYQALAAGRASVNRALGTLEDERIFCGTRGSLNPCVENCSILLMGW